MDKMILIITLRKDVTDKASAKALVEMVKGRLTDYPQVTITSHTTEHFDLPENTP